MVIRYYLTQILLSETDVRFVTVCKSHKSHRTPKLQNLDPSFPTSDKNASSHPAVQRRLTSDLPVSHHLTQREPSMIDDTCINHEAGDRDTNAEQSQKQRRGVYRVWWMKKTAKSRKKKN